LGEPDCGGPLEIEQRKGLQQIYEENLFTTRCPKFVRDAVEILEEMENG